MAQSGLTVTHILPWIVSLGLIMVGAGVSAETTAPLADASGTTIPSYSDYQVGPGEDPGNHSQRPDNESDARNASESGAGRPQEFASGEFDGEHVDFSYDGSVAAVYDYSVSGTLWWAEVVAPGPVELARAQGHQVRAVGESFGFSLTDNPAGVLRMHAEEGGFSLTPAEGVSIEHGDDRLVLTQGELRAYLTHGIVDGDIVRVHEGVFVVPANKYQADPEGPEDHAQQRAFSAQERARSQERQERILEAVAAKKMGAQVQLAATQDYDVLRYDEVEVKAEVAQGIYRVIVDANLSEGRTFVVDFAPGLVKSDRLAIEYYDEEFGALVPAAISPADNIVDVLDIEPGEGAEYYIDHSTGILQAFIAVPSFSVHAFDLIPLDALPSVAIGVALGAGLVLMMAVGLGSRRRTE